MDADKKRYVLGGVLAVALLAAAFSAGRFTAPLHVETKEVEVVRWKERIVEKEVKVEVAAKAEQRTVYVDRVIRDGEVREQIVEHWNTVETAATSTTTEKQKDSEGEKTRVVTTVTTLRSDWRTAVSTGVEFEPGKVPLLASPWYVAAEVDRRIVGGVSVGLQGRLDLLQQQPISGALGVVVSLEF